MSNMLDFIRWRGDLPFAAVPAGEVDGLILAQLSMLRWEIAPLEEAPLREWVSLMRDGLVSEGFTPENDRELLLLAGAGERFGGVLLGDYVRQTDAAEGMQFAAVTLRLGDGTLFISFRGTDNSIVGWKEDCRMAFSRPVPAQEAARAYLARIAGKYPGALLVGGHSKGGNLAMYAAATADEPVRGRVRAVYNYDGPGLSDRIDAASLYARLAGRLRSFVPQGSIVGLLLAHPDEYTVVRSDAVGILQHDPYSWRVEGPLFVRMPGLSRDSARFDIALRQWLSGVDEADRAVLVETLFGILSATNAQTFGREFWAGLAQNSRAVRAAIDSVDPDTRRRISRMLGELSRLAMAPPRAPEQLPPSQ